jgi:elongation factor G
LLRGTGEGLFPQDVLTLQQSLLTDGVVGADGEGDGNGFNGGILQEGFGAVVRADVGVRLYGLGDMHIDVVCSKLQSRFGVAVEQEAPKIPYRESIRGKADGEGKHKKQSGGSGQYGHVKVHFAPADSDGLVFTESTFGGSVPKNFHPAVQKGIEEAMQSGVLAGYPMVGVAADLYDGSYHDVDSNEISFKLAGILSFKDGIPKARPVLLEPIGELKVYAPDAYVGDVMGDLNRRRGRVMGIEAAEKAGYQIIIAEVPLGEMNDYVVTLRAATQGRARFDYEVIRYDEAPQPVTQKVIQESAQNKD